LARALLNSIAQGWLGSVLRCRQQPKPAPLDDAAIMVQLSGVVILR
jgi:hypothetical protein